MKFICYTNISAWPVTYVIYGIAMMILEVRGLKSYSWLRYDSIRYQFVRERFFWYAIILCSGVWPTSMKSNEATTPSRANKGSSPVKVGIYINIIVLEFFSWSTNMHILYMYIAIYVFFVQTIVLQKSQTILVYIYSLWCRSSWSAISCFKALILLKELHCVQNENSNYGQLSYFKSIEASLWWFLWYTLK